MGYIYARTEYIISICMLIYLFICIPISYGYDQFTKYLVNALDFDDFQFDAQRARFGE